MSKKTIIISAIITISLFLFYWFQFRPSQIRHDCSWVKEMIGYEPARPAITERELRENGKLGCEGTKTGNPFSDYFCEETIRSYKVARPEVVAREHWRQSSDFEYKFCLRDKGL